MKITHEYLIDFLIKLYSFKNAHEDFQILHQKQLDIVLKTLEIPGLITWTEKGFEFKLNNGYINKSMITIEENDKNSLLMYAQDNINHCLSLITKEKTIRNSGQLCSNKTMEDFHEAIHSYRNDFTLRTLNKAMIDIYKTSIKDSLDILYGADFSDVNNIVFGFNINETVSFDDELILNETIDEFDYM